MTVGLVVVSTRSFGAGEADPRGLLEAAGCRVEHLPGHDLDTVRDTLADAVGWIAGTEPVTAAHLEAAPRLRIVARYGTGTESVDLAAARKRGVVVTNTPGANADAVAEHTIGLMLAALRGTVAADRAVRAGDWTRMVGRELGRCTVGIVGYGTVGRAVRRRLVGFGSHVVAHDPYLADDDADIPLRGLAELAALSDVVTLHLPGRGRPVVDRDLLAGMRPGATLVNTARGGLLDEAAVADALRDGRLGACAVDVLDEPPGSAGTVSSPLLSAPRVTVTPHIAGQSVQAVDRMGVAAATECLRVLVEGRPPENPVVLPDARPSTPGGVA